MCGVSPTAGWPKRRRPWTWGATLIETHKQKELFCYKKFRAYQPPNVWWAEQQMVVRSEFRDGNVPAGFEQLRVLKQSLESLPEGVEKISMRSDSAGYRWDLLQLLCRRTQRALRRDRLCGQC
jgi:hypothetical protein